MGVKECLSCSMSHPLQPPLSYILKLRLGFGLSCSTGGKKGPKHPAEMGQEEKLPCTKICWVLRSVFSSFFKEDLFLLVHLMLPNSREVLILDKCHYNRILRGPEFFNTGNQKFTVGHCQACLVFQRNTEYSK